MTEGGRVAAVTGAASGIGRATALALSRRGARVALCDRNAAGLAEVAKTIRARVDRRAWWSSTSPIRGSAAQAIDGVVEGWGRLDVLVNAAGILTSGRTTRGPVIGIAEEDWDRIIERQCARHGLLRPGGRAAHDPATLRSDRQHRLDRGSDPADQRRRVQRLEGRGADVHEVPGAGAGGSRDHGQCRGPGTDRHPHAGARGRSAGRARFVAGAPEVFRLGVPLGKLGKPEDVASAIVYLASEEAHHITGAILNVDGMAQLS